MFYKPRTNVRQHVYAANAKCFVYFFIYFKFSQVIIDLGGVTGLWLGFAFMTFMELFEFVTDMFVYQIQRLFKRISAKRICRQTSGCWNWLNTDAYKSSCIARNFGRIRKRRSVTRKWSVGSSLQSELNWVGRRWLPNNHL